MTQEITIPEIPLLELGSSEPYILKGKSTTGKRIKYSVVDGDAVSITDFVQLNAVKVGNATILATAPEDGDYQASTLEIPVEVVEAGYFKRVQAITKIKTKLDLDVGTLNMLAKFSLRDISSLSFQFGANSVTVSVNGQNFNISNKRFAEKYINSSTQFLQQEIIAEMTRLNALITDLKTIDPQ